MCVCVFFNHAWVLELHSNLRIFFEFLTHFLCSLLLSHNVVGFVYMQIHSMVVFMSCVSSESSFCLPLIVGGGGDGGGKRARVGGGPHGGCG